jgi:hypothetical protein
MSLCIIELNDIAVSASTAELDSVDSPGYALVQGARLIVGDDAKAQARLHPQQLNNRFWQRLSMDPISHSGDNVRHHADLAYSQLLQLHELAGRPAEVIFVVPGNFSPEQLSVLLGIAGHCPFRAAGLVDSAVAAAAGVEVAGDTVHIDLQLHQAVLTRLSVTTDIARAEVQTVAGAGLLSLYDRWAHIIADAFIEQCRFDPLHSATTEQYIYDQIPKYLAASDRLIDLEVPQGAGIHRARLERDLLLQAGAKNLQQVFDRADAMSPDTRRYLLGRQWADVPGIESYSPQSLLLPKNVTARACLEHADLICSAQDAVSFVTRLPLLKDAPPAHTQVKVIADPEPEPPTHILIASTAYSLATACFLHVDGSEVRYHLQSQPETLCTLGMQDGKLQLQILNDANIWLNDRALRAGEPVPTLEAGDRLRLSAGGEPAQLIRVNPDVQA